MGATLLLDRSNWDLVLDASGNIAVAAEPYALAQDAASAARTFAGECYFDTTVGVPYLEDVLGKNLPISILKQLIINAALTVPNVVAAQFFIAALTNRTVTGQIQVVSQIGQVSAAPVFSTTNPQGLG